MGNCLQCDAEDGGVLEVLGIDFCFDVNGANHHTEKFHLMTRTEDRCLVVRRGQAFKLDLLFNRPFDANKDAIILFFYVAVLPSDEKSRTTPDEHSAAVPILESGPGSVGGWSATYVGQENSLLTVSVCAAADCIVAAWRFDIDTRLNGSSSLTYTHTQPIYILFNPWCIVDNVYMPGDGHRDEYVLDDAGLIFKGVYNNFKSLPWYFAQYEKDVLDCALYLVKRIGKVRGRGRADPIRTSRALSAAVNASDDNGVLEGNWGLELSDYSGGTHPLQWVGSMSILQEYFATRMPVKYGQCWVFAGVLTSVCRALGIPCRPVTGFRVAHDTEGSLTVDSFIDDEGNVVDKTADSVWTFHVWNEVWMDRPDLGAEYGGWQVLDATPQELSNNMYRCGPASLRAIKEAELQKPYDAGYVYAEVNADVLTWKYSGDGHPLKLLYRDTSSVGQNISTKAMGKIEREDITATYKYPEGTHEERVNMEKALNKSHSIFAKYYLNDDFNDVTFNLELHEPITIGESFSVVLQMRNKSNTDSHLVNIVLRVDTVTQKGVSVREVKSFKYQSIIYPKSKETTKMPVSFEDYYEKLVDHASFKVACLATIVDKNFHFYAYDDFQVRNPDIEINIAESSTSRQEFVVSAKLVNPLPIPLTNGSFYIEGPGLEKPLKIKIKENISPGDSVTVTNKLIPPWAGRHQISAKFTSKEIHDVHGFLSFSIAPPTDNNRRPFRIVHSV
ncbi:annulin-like [Trichoplusia ni]|uniref:protein-glutamine gamma-glutamyltransferase n=1 Tax=Trichoplusia ni TaxID=7111 RepID=A0A7E5VET2_TRINI|nr:annulin-like [Trichoplusia ni]